MAFCDSTSLSNLLSQWGAGSLDSVAARAHVVAGLEGCVVSSGGLRAETLAQRFTSEDVNKALLLMFRQGFQKELLMLTSHYLLGWTAERLGRVLGHSDASHTLTLLISAEDCFAGMLLDGPKK